MADWKDILSDKEEQLTGEELLRYLHHDIPEHEKDLIEKKIQSGAFESDALEGLSRVQSQETIQKHVGQLHLKLRQLTAKKTRKEKEKIKIFEWMILAILILLFICIISFIIITLHNNTTYNTGLNLSGEDYYNKYLPGIF